MSSERRKRQGGRGHSRAIFDSTWGLAATGTENEVNPDNGHQRQQLRRFCREVTSVVFTEISGRSRGHSKTLFYSTENEVNPDNGHQRQQPRRFCREVTSVVCPENPGRDKGTEGTSGRSSIAPGNTKPLTLKTKLTETTAISDSSLVASVEK